LRLCNLQLLGQCHNDRCNVILPAGQVRARNQLVAGILRPDRMLQHIQQYVVAKHAPQAVAAQQQVSRSPVGVARYARESPTWPMYSARPISSATVHVVPMSDPIDWA
jgi:hypothetical protein